MARPAPGRAPAAPEDEPGTARGRQVVVLLEQVRLAPLSFEPFEGVIGGERYREQLAHAAAARELLDGRVLWNVNSTSAGGGVAEMLTSLICYVRGAHVDARWAVISGNDDFFKVTKRIHNRIHGGEGDGGELGDDERAAYERTLEDNTGELLDLVGSDDIVILHDPQTVGLAKALRDAGARVIWRCHVGLDEPNDVSRSAWTFLLPYADAAEACVFSRREHVWEPIEADRVAIIPPSIDAFSAKNQDLDDTVVDAILHASGVIPAESNGTAPRFTRRDGTQDEVSSRTAMIEDEPIPTDARMITQVSRWDRLKDPLGVLRGFVEHVEGDDVHLVLAGPEAKSVADDPEGAAALQEVQDAVAELDDEARKRVHLAPLPADDVEENAAIVNALQRRSQVVVQKSLAEGFGLTVAEAMWKARPVVASRVGGIQDQIEDGRSGVLVDDPRDLAAFGAAVRGLLDDESRAAELGRAARERVREEYLAPRHLEQYVTLIGRRLERNA